MSFGYKKESFLFHESGMHSQTSRHSCKQSATLTGLTLNGKCARSFAEEKYAIDAGSVRAPDNGHHEPNKWFSIVRGMIMFAADLSRDCARVTTGPLAAFHRPTF